MESDCIRLDCSTPQSSCYILKSRAVTVLVDMSTHEIFRCCLTFSLSQATPAVSLWIRSTLSLSRCLLRRSNLRLAVRSTVHFRLRDVRGDYCPHVRRYRPPLVRETKQVISGLRSHLCHRVTLIATTKARTENAAAMSLPSVHNVPSPLAMSS